MYATASDANFLMLASYKVAPSPFPPLHPSSVLLTPLFPACTTLISPPLVMQVSCRATVLMRLCLFGMQVG